LFHTINQLFKNFHLEDDYYKLLDIPNKHFIFILHGNEMFHEIFQENKFYEILKPYWHIILKWYTQSKCFKIRLLFVHTIIFKHNNNVILNI